METGCEWVCPGGHRPDSQTVVRRRCLIARSFRSCLRRRRHRSPRRSPAATSRPARSDPNTLHSSCQSKRRQFAALDRDRGRAAQCRSHRTGDRDSPLTAQKLSELFFARFCVSIRQPMKMQLARSLLFFGLIIAGCGPSHKGAPVDGLPAGDAQVLGDGQIFDNAPPAATCGLTSCVARTRRAVRSATAAATRSLRSRARRRISAAATAPRSRAAAAPAAARASPRTCAGAGADCGKIADGCGGLTASCGTCPTGEVCGANGVANMCGVEACTGLCAQQNACTNQPHTTITGKVTTPGHDDIATWGPPDPIYGALVYVPNGSAGPPRYGVTAFAPGVACDSCESLVSGAPLVTATTAVDGTFTIDNAPCGTAIPLVIQLGRWRRQITIPSVACCANTALTAAQTHLPRDADRRARRSAQRHPADGGQHRRRRHDALRAAQGRHRRRRVHGSERRRPRPDLSGQRRESSTGRRRRCRR